VPTAGRRGDARSTVPRGVWSPPWITRPKRARGRGPHAGQSRASADGASLAKIPRTDHLLDDPACGGRAPRRPDLVRPRSSVPRKERRNRRYHPRQFADAAAPSLPLTAASLTEVVNATAFLGPHQPGPRPAEPGGEGRPLRRGITCDSSSTSRRRAVWAARPGRIGAPCGRSRRPGPPSREPTPPPSVLAPPPWPLAEIRSSRAELIDIVRPLPPCPTSGDHRRAAAVRSAPPTGRASRNYSQRSARTPASSS